MQPRTVGSIATRSLISIREDEPAQKARELLAHRHVGALVVLDDRDAPVGLFSATDLVRRVGGPARAQVKDLMSPTIFSVDEATPVTAAAHLMAFSRIHRLLITKNGKVFGLVSLTDIVRLVGEVGLRDEPEPVARALDETIDIASPRDLFSASLARCNGSGQLAMTFYDTFIRSSPAVARHFANTQMDKQRRVISEAFQLAIDVANNKPGALARLNAQAERHDRRHLDIRPELYDVWMNCLIDAVRRCDPSYGPVVEQAWRTVIGYVADYMRRRWA